MFATEFRDRRLCFPEESVPLKADSMPAARKGKQLVEPQGVQEEKGALEGVGCDYKWGPLVFLRGQPKAWNNTGTYVIFDANHILRYI